MGALFGARAQRISRQHSKEMGLSPDELRNIAYGIPMDTDTSRRRRNSEETISSGSYSVRSGNSSVRSTETNHATSEEPELIVVDDQDHATSEELEECICPECKGDANFGQTICCDKCDQWFHFVCVGVTEESDCVTNENASFFCKKCKKPPKSSTKRKRVSKNEKKASKRPKLTLRQVVEDQQTSGEKPFDYESCRDESWQKTASDHFDKIFNYYENQKKVHGWLNEASEEEFGKKLPKFNKEAQEKIDLERMRDYFSWNIDPPPFNMDVFDEHNPTKTFIQNQFEDPEFNETDLPLYSIVSNL